MNELELNIASLESDGQPVTVQALGGLERVLSSNCFESKTFGSLCSALVAEIQEDGDATTIVDFLAKGLKLNGDRLALRESVEALIGLPIGLFRPLVFALESRTRNESDHPLIQAESTAGIMRFALLDSQWQSIACAALQAYPAGSCSHADPLICRLASAAYDFFGFEQSREILIRLAQTPETAAQAKTELGLIQVSSALSCDNFDEIKRQLTTAEKLFSEAVDADNERRDTTCYRILVKSILSVTEFDHTDLAQYAMELRTNAFASDLWDRPAPGMEWLASPSHALSTWVPVLDSLHAIGNRLNQRSWLNASSVLEHVYQLYSASRTIQLRGSVLSKYLAPTIEAAFIREKGLAAHLYDWIALSPESHPLREDAERLKSNVLRYFDEDRPPPKKH